MHGGGCQDQDDFFVEEESQSDRNCGGEDLNEYSKGFRGGESGVVG